MKLRKQINLTKYTYIMYPLLSGKIAIITLQLVSFLAASRVADLDNVSHIHRLLSVKKFGELCVLGKLDSTAYADQFVKYSDNHHIATGPMDYCYTLVSLSTPYTLSVSHQTNNIPACFAHLVSCKNEETTDLLNGSPMGHHGNSLQCHDRLHHNSNFLGLLYRDSRCNNCCNQQLHKNLNHQGNYY